ncbi:metallophosphatase domain-containing protein [Tenacibaculum sp. M341]|uniref:metallophosphatase domain-containing protein n=1 Tax=Tenacibaculum sp. M341 TaxID=2530339 RepID=UPI001044E705|nr:metallophosphatase domain-containing protein [Tenacibaculum sp. M341]TCI92172.1 metallophosphoesterase [Tenacibaculum sp. M341]
MKIICISDTHGFHRGLKLPKGDMIIHAGDVTKRGEKEEVIDFLSWYQHLDFKHKIFIAGNHDFFFEKASPKEINELIPSGITYLNDTGITIEGIKIWGSPIQPWFYSWAFNRQRGKEIQKHWDKIPNGLDILITHGPAYGVLDLTQHNQSVGCQDLFNKIREVKPKIHITGHIHEAYGRLNMFGVDFVNASVLSVKYELTNPPIEIDF